jgi:crotonobetainyl-CoA:carnitine CoA-transferase CaiB-like acyl-CoA transferase
MAIGILSEIRVLDFTRVLAGPYATRMLGDFGAEVIKVQSNKASGGGEDNNGPYFNAWNRNKMSITLDMRYPEAKEIVKGLTAMSDVVIENFTPRVMSNWGLGYEELRQIRKDLIMVSMSGMGQSGPWRDFTAFGPTIHSLSGHTYLTSYDKDSPVGIGFSYADIIAGLYAVFAVLAALKYRENTGCGQYIDLSEYEAACTLLGPVFLDLTANNTEIRPQGNRTPSVPAAPYGCYPCLGEDRWCAIAVFSEDEWRALRNIMENPSWAREHRFSTLARRKQNEAALDKNIGQWTRKQNAEEIAKRLQEAYVSAGVVQNAADLAKDVQLIARNLFREIEHPRLGTLKTDRCPIASKDDGEGPWKPSPLLGEDNDYVYGELLHLSDEARNSLVDKGIIA